MEELDEYNTKVITKIFYQNLSLYDNEENGLKSYGIL